MSGWRSSRRGQRRRLCPRRETLPWPSVPSQSDPRPILQRDGNRSALAVSDDLQRALLAHPESLQHPHSFLGGSNRLAVDAHYDVTPAELGLVGRTTRGDLDDEGPVRIRQTQVVGMSPGHFVQAEDSMPGAPHVTVRADLVQKGDAGIDRDGEADADRAAAAIVASVDEAVDADDLAQGVDERAAAVAAIDSRIRPGSCHGSNIRPAALRNPGQRH